MESQNKEKRMASKEEWFHFRIELLERKILEANKKAALLDLEAMEMEQDVRELREQLKELQEGK